MIEQLATNYGTMFVPTSDAGQYWWLANTGASPEDEFIETVCNILDGRPRGTVVDVGANFGCWTLPLSQHAHKVVAIEPQRCCWDLLRRSVAMNRIMNVSVLNCAAGARVGRVAVPDLDLEQETNFGGVSLAMPHHEQPNAKMSEVDLAPLDHLLNGEPVSFIKIDVEGFEADVIAGARRTIERCHPVLFVEMDHPQTDSGILKAGIEKFGYATQKHGGNYLGLPL